MTHSQEKTHWWRWAAYALVSAIIAGTWGALWSQPGFNYKTHSPAFFTDGNFRLIFRVGFCLCGFGLGPLLSQAYDFLHNHYDPVYGTSGYTRRSKRLSCGIFALGIILSVAAIMLQKNTRDSHRDAHETHRQNR